MAQYRAKAQVYVGGRLYQPGDTFTGEGVPGLQWDPIDDEAKAAVAARPATLRGQRGKPQPDIPPPAASTAAKSHVTIPDEWRYGTADRRIDLAVKLGAPKGITAKKAEEFIEAEVARRAVA